MAFDLGSKFSKKISGTVTGGLDKLLPGNDIVSKTAKSVLGASGNRLLQAGLKFAGVNILGEEVFNNISTATFRDNDTRVRIGLSPGSGSIFYKDPSNQLLSPLLDTDGIMFPYTPNVNINYSASYSALQPTHSNYAQHAYAQSSVDFIGINGMFTANTADEARYVLAVLHFMRTATKMFYGTDGTRGTPPPVLRFSGYGPFQFNSVPVVLSSFAHDFENTVDYIEVPLASSPDASTKTMVPTQMMINMNLLPIYTRSQVRNFSLEGFAKGDFIGKPGGPGGFV